MIDKSKPTAITATDAEAVIEEQIRHLRDMLTPNPDLWGDDMPHGFHSDDGRDYLEAAIDLAAEFFPLQIDMPHSLPDFISKVDRHIEEALEMYDLTEMPGDAFDYEDFFPPFACDGVTDLYLDIFVRRAREIIG